MQKRIISMVLSIMMVVGIFGCLPEKTATVVNAATASQENIVKRANALYACKWTAEVSTNGWRNNSTFVEGGTYRVPYGQPVSSGKYVGYGVTPVGFLQATQDASNAFYTSRSYYSGNSGSYAPYYATDCSAYVSYAWGLASRRTTATLGGISTSLGAATSANVDKIQIGDALNSDSVGHVVLVTGVTYSGSTLSSIEITEQTPPQLKRSTYDRAGLIAKYSVYTILRYTGTVSAPTFTIQYNANGGSGSMANQTVNYETATTLSANKFTRSGYTFKGWKARRDATNMWLYKDADGDKTWFEKGSQPDGYSLNLYKDQASVSKTGYGVEDTVTLYATWEKDSGTDGTVIFQFDANGGTGTMSNQTITYGTETALSANKFTRSGYTFQGWWAYRAGTIQKYRYTNADGSDKGWYTEGEQPDGYYPFLYANKEKVSKVGKGTGDTVIMYAMWGSVNYTVSYKANGGSGTMANSSHIRGIPKCLTANAFTRSGHTFAGWYMYKPSKGTYLYSIKKGKNASWYKPGEQPAGWRLSLYKDQKIVSTLAKTEGVEVQCIAQWTPNTTGTTSYYIDFNANGGTGTMSRQKIVKGTSTALTANAFTYTGHTFLGWYVHRRSDNKWKYVDSSGSAGWISATDVADDTEFKLIKNKASVSDTSSVDCDIITLYAVWDYGESTYTLKYMANGGSGTMADQEMTWGVSTNLTTNKFTRAGYTFGGWQAYRVATKEWRYTNGTDKGFYVEGQQPSDYTQKFVYTDGQTVGKVGTGDGDTVYMYAVWNANTYKIAYNANGGSGSMGATTATYGTSAKLSTNTFTKTGYTFGGWTCGSTSYSNGQSVSNLTTTNNGTVTMTAVWNPISYTIAYNSNGGSGTMGSTTAKYDTSVALATNTFTKTGYIFNGWTCGSTSYSNGQSVSNLTTTNNGTVTMTANWKPISYTVVCDSNGGTGSMDSLSVEYGNSVSLFANAFKKGDGKFTGWTAKRASDGYVYCINKSDSTAKNWMAESSMGSEYEKYVFADCESVNNLTTANGDTITLSVQWKQFGDTNGDSNLNISDVTKIQETLAGIVGDTIPTDTCDLDGDGAVTIRDATYIQLYLSKLVSAFPVCK